MALHPNTSEALQAFLKRRHGLMIGGEIVDAANGGRLDVRDPGTGEVIATVPYGDAADIDSAIRAARRAFENGWRDMKSLERGRLLGLFADRIEADAAFLAELETIDNGAPLALTRAFFLPHAIATLRYYAGWPSKLTGETLPVSAPGEWHAFTVREPIGVVGQIIPWNAPIMLAIQKAAPALAAGCSVVIKSADLAPLSVLRLAELALEAGIPPGVLNVVTGDASAGEALVEHPGIDKIAFTGSTRVGRQIMHAAAGTLKRVALELGGKSPTIIFNDADLDAAIPGAAYSVFLNSGQVCLAGTRLLIQRKVYDRVVAGIADIANNLPIGHGLEEGSVIGPLISEGQRERVLNYVALGLADGAELVTGGSIHGEAGYFMRPGIFAGATPDMAIDRDGARF